ncbi:MAG: hypothetical protein Q8K62_08025 [Thiobacillus sp.]|nr:hypothetical protein [Thiobacillus sp.]
MRHLSTLLASFVLAGCAVYPASRTFYEPNAADGKLENRTSCGYTNTRDSIRRTVEGVEIWLSPSDEKLSAPYPTSLQTNISFTYRISGVQVDFSKIVLRTEPEGVVIGGQVLSTYERPTLRIDGEFQRQTGQLLFPAPAGVPEQITIIFKPGALTVDGRVIPISPFRFSRVTRSDIYYGSINC